jgi:hypothetical protein
VPIIAGFSSGSRKGVSDTFSAPDLIRNGLAWANITTWHVAKTGNRP